MTDLLAYLIEHDAVLIALIGAIIFIVYRGTRVNDRVAHIDERLTAHEAGCEKRHDEVMRKLDEAQACRLDALQRLARLEGRNETP